MALSLSKRTEIATLNLSKKIKKIPTDLNVQLALDVSGSMQYSFRSGDVLTLLERIFSVCNILDEDKQITIHYFSTYVYPALNFSVEQDYENISSIVRTALNAPYWEGTNFAGVLGQILKTFVVKTPQDEGMFGFLTNVFKKSAQPKDQKNLILFITDGENGDKANTDKKLKEFAKIPNTYIQFIDVGSHNESLAKYAEELDFVGYSRMASFSNQTDDAVLDSLLTAEMLQKFGA